LTKLGHQGGRARVVIGHDKNNPIQISSAGSKKHVDVPEWLSGMTRNHVGFARAGSNPAVHVLYGFSHFRVQMFICNLAYNTVIASFNFAGCK
jgi:hypothetical protein